jgi:hypothetical protein
MAAPRYSYSRLPNLRRGAKLGKYQLLSQLGHGGFSQVWKAIDLIEKQAVALKIPQITGRLGLDEEELHPAARPRLGQLPLEIFEDGKARAWRSSASSPSAATSSRRGQAQGRRAQRAAVVRRARHRNSTNPPSPARAQ